MTRTASQRFFFWRLILPRPGWTGVVWAVELHVFFSPKKTDIENQKTDIGKKERPWIKPNHHFFEVFTLNFGVCKLQSSFWSIDSVHCPLRLPLPMTVGDMAANAGSAWCVWVEIYRGHPMGPILWESNNSNLWSSWGDFPYNHALFGLVSMVEDSPNLSCTYESRVVTV